MVIFWKPCLISGALFFILGEFSVVFFGNILRRALISVAQTSTLLNETILHEEQISSIIIYLPAKEIWGKCKSWLIISHLFLKFVKWLPCEKISFPELFLLRWIRFKSGCRTSLGIYIQCRHCAVLFYRYFLIFYPLREKYFCFDLSFRTLKEDSGWELNSLSKDFF